MKVRVLIRFFLVVFVCMAMGHQVQATHLRAGEITVRRENCGSLRFSITITVFTNTKNTPVKFGGDVDVSYLDFGDGTREFVPEVDNIVRLDLAPDGSIATASYTTTHTYGSQQSYKISYQEPNRNGGVLNMDQSITTLFYLETVINMDLFFASGGCSNSPRLLVPPIDRACVGAAWTHNPGAFDPDGDSISYEMVIPNSDENVNVVNYRDPNNPGFYTNYETANEEGNGRPEFKINAVTGTITWDAPGGSPGEYNIAFIIKEWRIIKGQWYSLGFVRRDMQIIVEDCENRRPTIEVPEELCVVAGTTIRLKIRATDPDDFDPVVKIEAFSEIFNFAPAQFPAYMIYSPLDTLLPKYEPKPTDNVYFQWDTKCLHIKDQPYQVVFKVTDNPPAGKGAKLATFETWTIKVVGPPPVWKPLVQNKGTRTVQLNWENYDCQNADSIKVYRRVDSFDFTPDNCETGLPGYAGYSEISRLSIKDVTFLDNNNGQGLSPGAKYCYRLVAYFPKPRGGESYVSEEICVDPFDVDAPVITNVSISKSSTTTGQVFVRWTRPFDVDPADFPPPYQYKVYRGDGPAGAPAATPIATLNHPDTTFMDVNLNTEENIYNYRIEVFANGGVNGQADFIDVSKPASTVRMEAKSLLKKIELTWSAAVPWSNQFNATAPGEYSKHLIFRGPEGSAENDLVLIDSVDVTTGEFIYTDGETVPLEDNLIYCYRIMTRGTYGNPAIPNPDGSRTDPPKSLINFSQVICAQPGDETAPCQPVPPIAKDPISCEEYIATVSTCGNRSFSNTITWERPEDPLCRNDISYYDIYASSSTNGEFKLLKTRERTTSFTEDNLPSFARCYKIRAVDRSGNESELSNAVCFDNCPYYELPNVFTPNQDPCNGRFSAFSGNDRYIIDPNSEVPAYLCDGISTDDLSKCARFVERVVVRIYNRWGKEVYSYSGASNDDVKSIYVDWDGRAEDGTDLASGIYFYVADVTFNSVDPAERQKSIKGWVHLIR